MVKSKRFTEEQIIEMFKEHEASTKVPSTGRCVIRLIVNTHSG